MIGIIIGTIIGVLIGIFAPVLYDKVLKKKEKKNLSIDEKNRIEELNKEFEETMSYSVSIAVDKKE